MIRLRWIGQDLLISVSVRKGTILLTCFQLSGSPKSAPQARNVFLGQAANWLLIRPLEKGN